MQQTTERVAQYIGGKTGVRHETVTRREWLRAGAGNEIIKETGEAEGR